MNTLLALSRRDVFKLASVAALQTPPGTVPSPPPPATFAEGPAFQRVTLEMSPKPFRRIDDAYVRAVCRRIFRQWDALLRRVDSVAVELFTADGSEILEYRGRMDDEIEWARYIGIGTPPKNPPDGDPERKSLHAQPRLYMENPPRITYGDLRRIIGIIKTVGREVSGKPVTVGAMFDPGPEFANSRFKYVKHPEIASGGAMGTGTWVTCTARLKADKEAYAGFPGGIPESTSLGTFLGRQSAHFLRDLGFDYLWIANGFGFSVSAWNVTGPLFDGKQFDTARAGTIREEVLGFWRDFRKECPKIPLETRGTNLLPGTDLATAATPLRDIYRGGFNMVAPPNSPWAALDGDFGLELAGYLARISELPPGDLFPFRYYIHDPWWLNSPWLDRYNREPHDIYLPLATARLNAEGNVTRPGYLEFLTIDDSYGRTPDQCPNEVIPHILYAMDHFSDEPGLVTWVYPFDEYHDLVFGERPDPALPFFGDWFVRSAVNEGFPLNTVVSTRNYLSSLRAKPGLYGHTVLLSPVPAAGSAVERSLLDQWQAGQDILFYGPVRHASARLREAIGVDLGSGLEGVLTLESHLPADRFRQGTAASRLHHRVVTSAGPVDTVASAASRQVETCASVSEGGQRRAYATFRAAGNGQGKLGWLRGTLSASITNERLPVADDPAKLFPAAALLRHLLSRFGIGLQFENSSPGTRSPLLLGARSNNGYFLSGYSPSTATVLKLNFPWGAPVLSGCDAWLESPHAQYTMPRAWHRELRCFVQQEATGEVGCAEVYSGHPGIRRRLVLRGLRNATVHFLPERGTRPIFAVNDLRLFNEQSTPYETHDGGHRLSTGPVTGTLLISW
jgi:hypothetical protein